MCCNVFLDTQGVFHMLLSSEYTVAKGKPCERCIIRLACSLFLFPIHYVHIMYAI